MASSTCVHSQHFKVAPAFYFPPEILKLNFLCLFATFQHQPEKYHPHKQKSKSIMQGKTLQTWIFLSAVHMRSDYHYPQHEPLCGMVVPSFLKIFFLLGGKTRKVFYLIFVVLHFQKQINVWLCAECRYSFCRQTEGGVSYNVFTLLLKYLKTFW